MKSKMDTSIKLTASMKLLNADRNTDDDIKFIFLSNTEDDMVEVRIRNFICTDFHIGYFRSNEDIVSVIRKYRETIDQIVKDILSESGVNRYVTFPNSDIKHLRITSVKEDDIYKVTIVATYNTVYTKDISVCYRVTKGDINDLLDQLEDMDIKAQTFIDFSTDEELIEVEKKSNSITLITCYLFIILHIILIAAIVSILYLENLSLLKTIICVIVLLVAQFDIRRFMNIIKEVRSKRIKK